MKFLINVRTKDVFMTLPPETQARLNAASFAFVDKYLKTGKCKEAYLHGDMKGAVSIWEVDAVEEGARLHLESPMSPFQDVEVMPIVEWDIGTKIVKEAYEKAAQK